MENKNIKRIASHTVAIVIGLMFASCVMSPRVSIVEKPVEVIKEVRVEVPVEIIKEVVKTVTKIKNVVEYRYLLVYEPSGPFIRVDNTPAAKNRLYLAAGAGYSRLSTSFRGSSVEVKRVNDLVMGLGYQRKFNNFVLGGLILTNGTVLGTIGEDF